MYFKGLCLLKSKTVDFGGFRTKKFTNFETLFGLKTCVGIFDPIFLSFYDKNEEFLCSPERKFPLLPIKHENRNSFFLLSF